VFADRPQEGELKLTESCQRKQQDKSTGRGTTGLSTSVETLVAFLHLYRACKIASCRPAQSIQEVVNGRR
jgi:hypothetical protein